MQFTSTEFTRRLETAHIRISSDGRGRAFDNIFVERLWRTVKYEEVYLKDYQTVPEAVRNLRDYFTFYNHERLHQALGYKTPAQVYIRKQRRVWRCKHKECGFRGHRDLVASVNMHRLAYGQKVTFSRIITYLRPGQTRQAAAHEAPVVGRSSRADTPPCCLSESMGQPPLKREGPPRDRPHRRSR